MARMVKEQEYAARRNAILDAAQRLVGTKGYEQMTIQDLLDELQISSGAFYHYFDSKSALLEALTERMQDEAEQLVLPIVNDPELSALDKFQRFFASLNRWKTARRPFVLGLMRVWYADENAIVRQKVQTATVKRVMPWLSKIIEQGVREGAWKTSFSDQLARVILSIVWSLGDTLAELLLANGGEQVDMHEVERIVAASTDAIERVLGAPTGSLQLTDAETLRKWWPGQ